LKVVILAGGRGTRLAEETNVVPKPMVRIGGRPIIWHIMRHYARHGFKDFVIACGYKGYVLKEYFSNYLMHESDLSVRLDTGETTVLAPPAEDWTVTLADTGLDSMTGGRIGRLRPLLEGRFLLTYGDGLSNVPLDRVIALHDQTGATVTVTAVSPPPRFGAIQLEGPWIRRFTEKPINTRDTINGGFFVVEPEVFDLIDGDDCVFETGPLHLLAESGRLAAYRHDGFWMGMDTVRERDQLNAMAQEGIPPWEA
jgi:glucose-1-phosphate cytidylyltransferase